jgi:hypothetical protein
VWTKSEPASPEKPVEKPELQSLSCKAVELALARMRMFQADALTARYELVEIPYRESVVFRSVLSPSASSPSSLHHSAGNLRVPALAVRVAALRHDHRCRGFTTRPISRIE